MRKCTFCGGTGKYKEPNNVEEFDIEFDRLDKPGFLSLNEAREKALLKTGYTLITCPNCNGTGSED